ncbi:hypothetical protein Tco_0799215 [Tanacetum coccineum]
MVVFKVLKKQLQLFITMQISMDSIDQKTNHFFTEYILCDAQMFQNILNSLMDSIEKAIAERRLYKRAHDNMVHERTMQMHEGMISQDASEIDNNVAGASHDKDNITEVQMKPDVHDTEEILNDAEESQVKMKEKQFQFNYDNMNSLYDMFVPQTELSLEQEYFSDPSTSNVSSKSSKEMSDLPIPKMPNEISLSKSSKELQQELTEEVHEMLNIFESMERKVDRTSKERCYSSIKIIAQKSKDFDDVKFELANRTAKFEAYFKKLKNTKVVLERQLARKVDDSKAEKDNFLKEINHLRAQLENLRGKTVETKFDKPLILVKPPADKLLINSQNSKSWFTPKVVVQKDLSKLVTTQSLPKNEKDQF